MTDTTLLHLLANHCRTSPANGPELRKCLANIVPKYDLSGIPCVDPDHVLGPKGCVPSATVDRVLLSQLESSPAAADSFRPGIMVDPAAFKLSEIGAALGYEQEPFVARAGAPLLAGAIALVCVFALWRRYIRRRESSKVPGFTTACVLVAALVSLCTWVAWDYSEASARRLSSKCQAEYASKDMIMIRRLSDGAIFNGPRTAKIPPTFAMVLPVCARENARSMSRSASSDWLRLTATEVELVRAVSLADEWAARRLVVAFVSGVIVLVGMLPLLWYFTLARIREVSSAIRGERVA